MDDGLHTPCQDVPMPIPGNSRYARTPRNSNEWASYGWEKMARGFLGLPGGDSWNNPDQMFFDPNYPKEMSLGFSRADIEYKKLCDKKDREIMSKLKPRQHRLMDALNRGKIFKLSRLKIEVNN